jgi:acetylornithine deacetylase/succinyl-diaminopimelate desuccinylase-like protein
MEGAPANTSILCPHADMRNPSRLLLAILLLSSAPAVAGAQQPVDWPALEREAVGRLQEYLRLDTTNPPGHELEAARFFQRLLAAEGIEARLLDTAELQPAGRANLYARLRGNGSRKAIALVNHMDVVPASAGDWSVPPFSGEIRDGYVYGRGALDMKGNGLVQLMAMIALKRSGVPLTRDIVFIGNADEELGSTGAMRFADAHADLLRDVEFLLTEGGGNVVSEGGDTVQFIGVGVAEKRTFWHRLTVRGTAGHGSRPLRDNPVVRLVHALDALARHETPLHVTPGVARYFRDLSSQYRGEQRRWLADVRAALREPRGRRWILADPGWNAVLRNTISLTGLAGSNKTNVIPAEASAELDIRLLPDTDPAEFLATLKRVVNDSSVHWTPLLEPKAPLESPIDTELFHAIERAASDRFPGARVTTPMLSGATDRPAYRKLGIVTYGFDPFLVPRSESARGVHGVDERLSVANVGFGVRYLYDVLRYAQ